MNDATLWPMHLTTGVTPDTGIPGTGSYGLLSDPVPPQLTPTASSSTSTPASTVAQGPVPYAAASSVDWKTYGFVGLLGVLLVVLAVWALIR